MSREISTMAKIPCKQVLSFTILLAILFLTFSFPIIVAQSSVLFSWQGTISPPVTTTQVWGDHYLFQKGTGYKEFVIGINQGYGASITATASDSMSLYVIPDRYTGPWYWVGDYYPGTNYAAGDSAYTYAARYDGSNLNVRFWAPNDDNWHFVFYDDSGSDITVSLQAVILEPAKVSINVSPSETVTFGQSVTISGMVTTSGTPILDGNIALTSGQGYGQDQTLANVALNNGQYSYDWAPDAGTYTVTAAWSGDGDYKPATSQQLQLTVNKMPVTVKVEPVAKVELDPLFQSPVKAKLTGQVNPPLSGTHITVAIGPTVQGAQQLQNLFNPSTFQSSSTQFEAVTDASGQFSTEIPIAGPGAYQAVVIWDGDANHVGFSQSVSIEAEWNYTPYIVVILIILLSLALLIYKVRDRILGERNGVPPVFSKVQRGPSAPPKADKIQKAKELLDAGLITPEDFDLLKSRKMNE
jgi:hypothetical protein